MSKRHAPTQAQIKTQRELEAMEECLETSEATMADVATALRSSYCEEPERVKIITRYLVTQVQYEALAARYISIEAILNGRYPSDEPAVIAILTEWNRRIGSVCFVTEGSGPLGDIAR
jgi:hypothetical protein